MAKVGPQSGITNRVLAHLRTKTVSRPSSYDCAGPDA